MEKIVCKYTVMRYIPDLVKDEAKNIAVLLYDETNDKCYYTFKKDVIEHKLSKEVFDSVHGIFDLYFDNLPKNKGEFDKLFNFVLNSIPYNIVFTDGRYVVVTSTIENELEYLSKTFIE